MTNILCCDWGTSSFRLRLVDPSDFKVLAELQKTEGVAETFRTWQKDTSKVRFDFYGSKLRSAIDEMAKSVNTGLTQVPVIVSGMASSSIGMEEVPYASLPFKANGSQASVRIVKDFNGAGMPLVLVSGVKSDDDVMRGEEAQLIGLFNLPETSELEKNNSIFVFPGTHSKHIHVVNNSITGFQTFMTGEVFNILSEHSILKDSIKVNSGSVLMEPLNISAFSSGVEKSGFANLLSALFTVRTNQLFSKFDKEQNAFYLSGLLIGSELQQLSKDPAKMLIICSGKHLYEHYKLAAEVLDLNENVIFIQPELIDKATIAGQVQLFKMSNTIAND
ncbi:MAG: 2-dehydro-3-deoxygalactonokinase [Daejeonella sp.]